MNPLPVWVTVLYFFLLSSFRFCFILIYLYFLWELNRLRYRSFIPNPFSDVIIRQCAMFAQIANNIRPRFSSALSVQHLWTNRRRRVVDDKSVRLMKFIRVAMNTIMILYLFLYQMSLWLQHLFYTVIIIDDISNWLCVRSCKHSSIGSPQLLPSTSYWMK